MAFDHAGGRVAAGRRSSEMEDFLETHSALSGDGRACPRRRSGLRAIERRQLFGQRAERRQSLVDGLVAGVDGAGGARPAPQRQPGRRPLGGARARQSPGPAGHDAGRRPRRRFRRQGAQGGQRDQQAALLGRQAVLPHARRRLCLLGAVHLAAGDPHRRATASAIRTPASGTRTSSSRFSTMPATTARSTPTTASRPRTAGCSPASRSTSTTTR